MLEAQAERLPAVARRVTGNVDAIIDNETGFLFPPDAARAAAEGIRRLMDDAALRGRMGLAAHRHVRERHDVRGVALSWRRCTRTSPAPEGPGRGGLRRGRRVMDS